MDDELKLRIEWAEARDEFVKAKKNRAKDPDGYAAAKAKVSQLRTYWRQIREALQADTDGAATPNPVAVSATKGQ